jgi:VIT1/CCC1 family predicted Fe2+/Mn2+ transporter
MAHDALSAHARDELGISNELRARPFQAALASAACFFVGGVVPLFVTILVPETNLLLAAFVTSLVFLALLGALAARAGGTPMIRSATRVTFWGALAMGITAGVGALFGTIV